MTCRKKTICVIVVTFFLLLSCTITDQLAEPTPTATFPPIPRTAIPQPSITPEPTAIPGWVKFEGGGIEMWLPESFEGGILSDDLDWILERIGALGPEYEPARQLIAQNPDAFILYALNSSVGADNFITNVNIVKEQVSPTTSLQPYIETTITQLPALMQVTHTEFLTINQYEAGKIELEYELEGRNLHQVMYLFKQGAFVWGVTFSTTRADFDQWHPVFELSISTFKINE